VLRLVLLEPVVLGFNLFLAVGTPSRDPIVCNRVENQTRALLASGQTLFFAEFFPLGLGLFFRSRLLSGSDDLRFRKVYTP